MNSTNDNTLLIHELADQLERVMLFLNIHPENQEDSEMHDLACGLHSTLMKYQVELDQSDEMKIGYLKLQLQSKQLAIDTFGESVRETLQPEIDAILEQIKSLSIEEGKV